MSSPVDWVMLPNEDGQFSTRPIDHHLVGTPKRLDRDKATIVVSDFLFRVLEVAGGDADNAASHIVDVAIGAALGLDEETE